MQEVDILEYAMYTDTGSRKKNEDAVRICTRSADQILLLVADGLGGHGGGDLASAAAVESILAGWDGKVDEASIKSLVLEANHQVLSLQTKLCSMKTTLVLLALDGTRLVRAHAGDSRLYHFQDGRLVYQSRDHSVAQMSVLLGDITPDQIRFHEDRSRVLRALGQDEKLTVETGSRTLPAGSHAFLLCTDGFWEYVLEEEMQEDLHLAQSPEDWIARMRARLEARVRQMYGDAPENDNNTAAALWCSVP